ncbi:hypothetical protein HOB30_00060 [Candidatus Falkowbacteria bacterium]|nr:hypothetical protein [Candidatus Falkowbacteria bacterium]
MESYKGTEFDEHAEPRFGTRAYYQKNPEAHPNFRGNRTVEAAHRRQAGIREDRSKRDAVTLARVNRAKKKDKLAISTVLSRIFGNKK